METNSVDSLLSHFSIPEKEYESKPSSSGFIHSSTIISVVDVPCYVLQKFNTTIFRDTKAVFANFNYVSNYLTSPAYRHFDWIPTRDQHPYYKDANGNLWRLLGFVPDSMELKQIRSTQEAYSCGKLLGLFHKQLDPADANSLAISIPAFHDLEGRWKEFENALESGIPKRIDIIKSEIEELALLREYCLHVPKDLPLRVCHNDTKLSNILFDSDSREALCFVDLDTLMPGYFYYDFGDLARTVVAPYSEDAEQIREQELNTAFLLALLEGLKASELQLQEKEISSLTYGLINMPFLHGIRALTDYVLGDRYYSVAHPEQNRYRALNLLGFAQCCFLIKNKLNRQIRSQLSATT